MDWEVFTTVFYGLVFYGALCSLPLFVIDLLKQHYVRKLCRYRGTKEKPGPGCVICAYHHECDRAKKSEEYKAYSYYRRVLPDHAKELFDKIWEEEKVKAAKSVQKGK